MIAEPKKIRLKCPRCGQPATWQGNPSRPFCSEKCRLIDLGRWSSEDYAIPGRPAPQAEDENEDY